MIRIGQIAKRATHFTFCMNIFFLFLEMTKSFNYIYVFSAVCEVNLWLWRIKNRLNEAQKQKNAQYHLDFISANFISSYFQLFFFVSKTAEWQLLRFDAVAQNYEKWNQAHQVQLIDIDLLDHFRGIRPVPTFLQHVVHLLRKKLHLNLSGNVCVDDILASISECILQHALQQLHLSFEMSLSHFWKLLEQVRLFRIF